MTRRTTTRWVAAAVATLLLVGLAPAQAAPTWLPEQTVSGAPFEYTLNARIAVDPLGNATAVWYHSAAGVGLVRASHRPAGGSWSAPLTISDPDRFAESPDVVVDRSGAVTAAWYAAAPVGGNQIESARLPVGGSWGSPTLVGAAQLTGPRLAVDNAGVVTVVWLEFRSEYIVRVSSLAPGGSWTIGKDLSNTAVGSINPQIAVDPSTGAAVAVWHTFDGTSLIYASRRPPGGAWSPAQLVSGLGENANPNPRVSIDPQGNATVVFGKYFTDHYEAFWSSAPQIGTWSNPQRLSTPGKTVSEVAVTAVSSGETVATWTEQLDATQVVRASSRSVSGTWSAAVPLSDPTGSAGGLSMAAGADGSTYALWQWNSGDSHPLQLGTRRPGGVWSAPVDVAAQPAYTPDATHAIGVDDDGDVAVAYLNGSPSPVTVAVRALDVAGPVVTLTAPTTATAGTTQNFTATATDHWSAVASYAWSFGDGGTATGPGVAHTYAAAGSYPVTLTVTDAVGNATTRTATTAVAAPVPLLALFKLKKKRIATDEKTKLKVGLNTASTLKLVFKSKHKHLVKGKKKYVTVVLRKQLPAGLSKITIEAKVKGVRLKPDSYVLTGVATNSSGKSPKKKVTLKVVR